MKWVKQINYREVFLTTYTNISCNYIIIYDVFVANISHTKHDTYQQFLWDSNPGGNCVNSDMVLVMQYIMGTSEFGNGQ